MAGILSALRLIEWAAEGRPPNGELDGVTHEPAVQSAPRRPRAVPTSSRISAHALNLDSYVPAYLTFLAGKISNSASATYRPKFGIGITDWRIMALLAAEPWISAGRVCDMIGLDKAAVSRSVRGMKSVGIVDVRWAGDDQHRQMIALTRKGLPCTTAWSNCRSSANSHFSRAFPHAERKMLINFLSRMHAQVVDTNATEMQR